VWILIASSETKSECFSGELTVTGSAWSVKPSASQCSESTYTVKPGSIIAYEMSKVSRWNKHEYTQSARCPSGYSGYEVRKSPLHPHDRCKRTSYSHVGIKCALRFGDKASNWYVSSRSGRDTCKSRKGKKDRGVKCSKSGYSYVSQPGRDTCRKANVTYNEAVCSRGWDYDKKSTGNGGRDQCHLKGVEQFKMDQYNGF
jgi:hypothetical protein